MEIGTFLLVSSISAKVLIVVGDIFVFLKWDQKTDTEADRMSKSRTLMVIWAIKLIVIGLDTII